MLTAKILDFNLILVFFIFYLNFILIKGIFMNFRKLH